MLQRTVSLANRLPSVLAKTYIQAHRLALQASVAFIFLYFAQYLPLLQTNSETMLSPHTLISLLAFGVIGNSFESANLEGPELPRNRCDVVGDLVPRLSREASVILPRDATFESFMIRASSPRILPVFSTIVEPATQEDVQETVSIDTLAVQRLNSDTPCR